MKKDKLKKPNDNIYKKAKNISQKYLTVPIRISISITLLIGAIFYSTLAFYQGLSLNDYSTIRELRLILGSLFFVFFIISLPINDEAKEKSMFQILFLCFALTVIGLDIAYFILKVTSQDKIVLELFVAILNIPMVFYFSYIFLSFTKVLFHFCKKIFKKITQTDSNSGLKTTIESITSVIIALAAFIAGIGGIIFTFKELIKSILL